MRTVAWLGPADQIVVEFVPTDDLKSEALMKAQRSGVGYGDRAEQLQIRCVGGGDGFSKELGSNSAILIFRQDGNVHEVVCGGVAVEPQASDRLAVMQDDFMAVGKAGRVSQLLAEELTSHEQLDLRGRQTRRRQFRRVNCLEQLEQKGFVLDSGDARGDEGKYINPQWRGRAVVSSSR